MNEWDWSHSVYKFIDLIYICLGFFSVESVSYVVCRIPHFSKMQNVSASLAPLMLQWHQYEALI